MDLVIFQYTNHRGETAWRHVRPIRINFASTAWHPEAQWLLEAFDLDKMATRDFAMSNITKWRMLPGPLLTPTSLPALLSSLESNDVRPTT